MDTSHFPLYAAPQLQRLKGEEPTRSQKIKIFTVAIGAILLYAGSLLLMKNMQVAGAGAACASGSLLIVFGSSIKCEKNTFNQHALDQSRHELEDEIIIPPNILEMIQSSKQEILKNKEDRQKFFKDDKNEFFKFHQSGENIVFEITSLQGVIFKTNLEGNLEQQYEKKVLAKTVVRSQQLDLLIIPKAKILTFDWEGKKHQILAEEKLNVGESAFFEDNYQKKPVALNEALKQLALFICKTGYSDVDWRNNPVLVNSLTQANWQIALFDLEEMEGAEVGLCGRNTFPPRRGLIKCVANQEQREMIKKIALKNRIKLPSFDHAWSEREKELIEEKRLKEFHSKTKVETGSEPITVDLEKIDFAPYTDEHGEKLKQIATAFIEAINYQLSEEKNVTIKERRSIHIYPKQFENLGLEERLEKETLNTSSQNLSREELSKETFGGFVIQKFIEQGVIFKLNVVNRNGYYFQV